MKVHPEVLEVLADPRLVTDGNTVQIPWQLGKRLYEMTNKVLKTAGGTWNGAKKVRAHVFPDDVDAAGLVQQIVLSGELVSGSGLGWFPTPPAVVEEALSLAGITEAYPGLTVLEPSAGTGALAGPARARGAIVDCVEIDEHRAAVLAERCRLNRVIRGDFLTDVQPLDYEVGFKRIIMNPPFYDAVAHVNHALGFLGDDALLVAVMPDGIRWRSERAHTELRQLVEDSGGELIRLPDDAFEPSGVRVHAVLAYIPTYPHGGVVRNHSWHLARPRQLDLFAA